MSDRIRVLLVDDQDLVRSGFRLLLEREPDLDVVGDVGDGAQAVAVSAQLAPDVVLMDVRMPVLDGIEATRRLGALPRPPRVLVLTTFDVDELVYDALAAGASGFLLKDVKAGVLADAIRTVHAGEALLAPSVTRRLITRFVASRPRPAVPVDHSPLTSREHEVLDLMSRGLSNAEICTTLVLAMATVKTHVSRVLAKLGARDRAQAIVRAHQLGLVTLSDSP